MRTVSFLIIFSFFLNFVSKADEGMWVLMFLNKNYEDMKKQGLKLTPEDIYNVNKACLKDAIVHFGRGCTGEIISAEGLILTNHHCGYPHIQEHSTVEHDYLTDGFWAASKDKEIPTPSLNVKFLLYLKDVTADVQKVLTDKMTEKERDEALTKVFKEIEDKEKQGISYRIANVRSFFGGNNFYLLVFDQYDDVRFVGAPPSSIGKFGADTDNWMWPRHTADFSLFRVYMSKDGKPAPYAKENVPLKPKHHLPVSLKGVKVGDYAMVLGYPGRTSRYMTSYEVDEVIKITNPIRIKIRGIRQDILMQDMQQSDKVRIQYASKYASSSNYWKYSIGQNKGLQNLKVFEKKQSLETEFSKWVSENPQRKEKYGEALSLIENAIKERKEYFNAVQFLNEAFLRSVEIGDIAANAGKLRSTLNDDKSEDAKKYAEKLREYAKTFFKDYNVSTDKKVTAAMIKLFQKDINEQFHPDFYKEIQTKFNGDIDKYVDEMFKTSIFADQERLNKFLDSPQKGIIDNDMAYVSIKSVYQKYSALFEKFNEYNANLAKGQRLFIAGLMEMQKSKNFYPDANSTMRLTYGSVLACSPKDGVNYNFYTTLKGVMEKEDPTNYEFVVPARLKELYQKKDYGRYGQNGEMWTCFITNNDITGGNSGSPVINGKGEIIGLAFDGNWEAMSGDIAFEPDLQRCINVDIRYVLFIIEKFANAKHIVDEMTIAK